MTQLQNFQVPNFAGDLLSKQAALGTVQAKQEQVRNAAALGLGNLQLKGAEFGLSQQEFGLKEKEFADKQTSEARKQSIEASDFALNLLSGVNSAEDMEIAKSQFKSRYPEKGQMVDQLLPYYSPSAIRIVRNSLRTETQRLKQEELTFEQGIKERETALAERTQTFEEGKPIGFSPGTMILGKGGRQEQVPFKPDTPTKVDYELFSNEKGEQFYVPKGGEVPEGLTRVEKKSSGVTINLPKAAPSGEREKLNKLFEFKSQLTRIGEQFDPKFTGRFEGLVGAAKELTGLGADEKESKFRQVVKDIADTLLRLRSGAQINEQEYKRLSKLVPTLNLPDKVFLARLDSLTEAIDNSITTRKATLSESGFVAPEGGTGGQTIRIKFDSSGNIIEGGQ